ncbi:MAG: MbtH family protein [Archangiaceae bacterium]|nr:MbtH family protein [Archangiaceae bacterium]
MNPFDDDAAQFVVLVNAEGQHSLWPARLSCPLGWRQVHGPQPRAECLAFVDRSWKDIRPLSLQRSQRLDS